MCVTFFLYARLSVCFICYFYSIYREDLLFRAPNRKPLLLLKSNSKFVARNKENRLLWQYFIINYIKLCILYGVRLLDLDCEIYIFLHRKRTKSPFLLLLQFENKIISRFQFSDVPFAFWWRRSGRSS